MQAWERKYLEWVAKEYDLLPYPRQDTPVKLTSLYVYCFDSDAVPQELLELDTIAGSRKFFNQGGDPEDFRKARVQLSEARRNLHQALAQHPSLFVVGPPGSGKSTFLRRVAVELAQERLGVKASSAWSQALGERALPILVPLPKLVDYADLRPANASSALSVDLLLDFVAKAIAESLTFGPDERELAHARTVLREATNAGRVVWLFDSLDELGQTQHRPRRTDALALVRQVCGAPQTPRAAVLTCREAAAQSADVSHCPAHFKRVNIAPLSQEQQRDFVKNWVDACALPQGQEAERTIMEALGRYAEVEQQATNPLFLTHLCYLATHGSSTRSLQELPSTWAGVYDALFTVLLADHPYTGLYVWKGPTKDLEVAQRRKALRLLANTGRPLGQGDYAQDAMREDDLCQVLDSACGWAPGAALDFLKFLDERTGLLAKQKAASADGQPVYQWSHATFGAFMLAEALVASTVALQPNSRAQSWLSEQLRSKSADSLRPAARFYVAKLAQDFPNQAVSFLRQLSHLAASEQTTEPSRAAALWSLAAQCVADWPAGARAEELALAQAFVDAGQAWMALADAAQLTDPGHRAEYWDAVAGRDQRLVDPAQRWVWVPEGEYWRGAASGDTEAYGDERRRGEEEPHRVFVQGFYIQRWPVTVREFHAFVMAGGYRDPRWWGGEASEAWKVIPGGGHTDPGDWPRQCLFPNRPVVQVCWHEAAAYCRWLQEHPEAWPAHLPEQWKAKGLVRLPWEAEWEKAARGNGDARTYVWQEPEFSPKLANIGDKSLDRLAPVGCYPHATSPFGAWDMCGNTWDWCGDWYDPRAYNRPVNDRRTPRVDVLDESVPKQTVFVARDRREPRVCRVLRGGGFGDHALDARVACRLGSDPWFRGVSGGFRCVFAFREDP